jgi:hypothetical protein
MELSKCGQGFVDGDGVRAIPESVTMLQQVEMGLFVARR